MLLKLKKIILTLLFFIICGLNVQATEHLNFNGFIADNADILSEQTESKLNQVLFELQDKTKADVAVVTINSLHGDAIENVSLKIARKYKFGDKKLNNGALMLVALDDRKVRIEIGYGLEGAITDAHSGRILDDYVIPNFKEGDYEKGIVDGTLVLANDIAKSYGQELSISSTLPASSTSSSTYTTYEAATTAELYQIIRDIFTAEDDGTGTIIITKIMFGIVLFFIAYALILVIFPLMVYLLHALVFLTITIINIFLVKFNRKPINIKKILKKFNAFEKRYCSGGSSGGSSHSSSSHSSHSSSSSRSSSGGGGFGGGGSSRGW